MNFHGPDWHHPLSIEMAPGTYAVKKVDIRRADGVNARVPAFRTAGRLIFHQGNTQPRVTQGQGQTGTGQTAANDDQIKLLHIGNYAGSRD